MEGNQNNHSSKGQILKSTGIVGGAKVIVILISIIRTKVVAIILGPAGVGIMGLFQSTITLIQGATNLGLGFSAVRDIAEANASNDTLRISKTILVFRRWIWFTGCLGFLITLIFCKSISIFTFGDDSYTIEFALLSITLLITAISTGQVALLQGLRLLPKMVKANIWGALAGLVVTIPLYFFFKEKGIVPGMILMSLVTLIISWRYSKRIKITPIKISIKKTFSEGAGMVKLGIVMVIAGLFTTFTQYLIRIFISNNMNIEGVGLFTASWSISTLYLGMVLDAMGTDYFPRLSAINTDNVAIKRLVNEQTEVAMILTLPLVIAMISFTHIFISIFYSGRFYATIPLLQWLIPGIFLRVIAWPMGFVIAAKAKNMLVIFTQLLWNLIFILLTVVLWRWYKLEAIGIASLVGYVVILMLNKIITGKIAEFQWSKKLKILMSVSLIIVVLASLNAKYIITPYNYIIGGIMVISLSVFTVWFISKTIDIKKIFKKMMGFSDKRDNQ